MWHGFQAQWNQKHNLNWKKYKLWMLMKDQIKCIGEKSVSAEFWNGNHWDPLSPVHGAWHMNASTLVHAIIEMTETSLSRNFMAKLLVFYIKTNEMSTKRTTAKRADLKQIPYCLSPINIDLFKFVDHILSTSWSFDFIPSFALFLNCFSSSSVTIIM